ncbi:23S rRNA (pseudouridine(1915)-N(3))-methyltransferase RlmH [Cerasicoccus arenae]|uniref:Ribosomal RNA large subunit methyltransferase H n=1 Tax=Cerasicoccus arenae TaxID=424488 RepID=A0A8J3GCM1_9BACT|nr:23S rRNA (pseudouridine(1915)-N(3))-methyltransferase RlmH [Cerasicoccus arenae]MBK1856887.1 23S rRNA (pseudouridine(1915)-N(3))-methyltransferase RlmH [Cerasicoccus arenae]GHB89666.1 ribosomal RNA large subunit methyltransferase H [Cerasicoccus arenae]
MFRLTLLVVGKLKNAHLRALCEDFSSRLQRLGRLEVVEFKDADPAAEGERFLTALAARSGASVWVLSEEGKCLRSTDLAEQIQARQGAELVFVIGGPFGLSRSVKQRADRLVSLSPMTFTHEMARYLLLEQLYRAASINTGSKYHHE